MKIELKHIRKEFEEATPLTDVNAVINSGDIIAIIGPSGTGKSTLMRCINMLDPPTAGEIYIDGVEITKNKAGFESVRQKMGMVFQSFNLFGHLTVVENVMFSLIKIKHYPKQKAYDIAMEQLRKVGMEEKALNYPDELSGGQKQRVSIARTIAMEPELIFLDEPTSALDPTMVREVESVICRLAESGKTMMIVTHEMRLAKAIANRVFYLDKGILYEDGTPEQIFNHPQKERTRAFVNNLKVFRYKFTTDAFSYHDCLGKFINYADNNHLPEAVTEKLRAAIGHIATDYVPGYMGKSSPVSIITELSPDTGKLNMLVYYNGNPGEMSRVLESVFSAVHTQVIEDKDFAYKAICEIQT